MEFDSIYVRDILGISSNGQLTATPILKECDNKKCLCTGKCQEIIGYIENNLVNPYPYPKNI